MRIMIVGAGMIDQHLSEKLSGEGQEVVLMDSDEINLIAGIISRQYKGQDPDRPGPRRGFLRPGHLPGGKIPEDRPGDRSRSGDDRGDSTPDHLLHQRRRTVGPDLAMTEEILRLTIFFTSDAEQGVSSLFGK